MKLVTKFVGSSTAVVTLIAALIGGNWFFSHRLLREAEMSRLQMQETLNTVFNLQVATRDEVVALKDYLLLDRSPSDMARFQKAMSRFQVDLDDLSYRLPQSDELEAIRRRQGNLETLAKQLQSSPGNIASLQQDVRAINSFSKDIEFFVDALVQEVQALDAGEQARVRQWQDGMKWSQLATLGGISLILMGQFYLILLPVVRALSELQLGAKMLGSGDLQHRVKIQTGDEIEDLAGYFNAMAEQLATLYQDLERRLEQVADSKSSLEHEVAERKQTEVELQQTLQELKQTQSQLIQTEKMSSLGQLVAGIAHEINNPINFIYGNIMPATEYTQDLLRLIQQYQEQFPDPGSNLQQELEDLDLPFIQEDLPKILASMQLGANRIREIVISLRNFSRLDEAEFKAVNLAEGIESTLVILNSRLKPKPDRPSIQVKKTYGELPLVKCYPGQLNQVFMNIIANAIDALEEAGKTQNRLDWSPAICISTAVQAEGWVSVRIADNGLGMSQEVQARLFDPFFTTKPVGQGTGLGLSISYQIVVEKHQGRLSCHSVPGQGTEFVIEIPISLH